MHLRTLRILGAGVLALALPLAASASEVTTFASAKALSATAGKPVLIDFSSPT